MVCSPRVAVMIGSLGIQGSGKHVRVYFCEGTGKVFLTSEDERRFKAALVNAAG